MTEVPATTFSVSADHASWFSVFCCIALRYNAASDLTKRSCRTINYQMSVPILTAIYLYLQLLMMLCYFVHKHALGSDQYIHQWMQVKFKRPTIYLRWSIAWDLKLNILWWGNTHVYYYELLLFRSSKWI